MDMFSTISSKSHGDASFSSYLNPKDDNFIRKVSESTRYLNTPDIIPGSGAVDGEIGVFGAEKYFNGGMDDKGSQRSTNQRKASTEPPQKRVLVHHDHDPDHVDEPFKPKPWLATPSVRSETSSNNSHKPLLKIVKDTTSTTTNNDNDYNSNKYSLEKRNNKSFLSNTLGYCMCNPCKGGTAVDVGEISFSNAVTTKPIRSSSKLEGETTSFRENPFSFPTGSLKLVHFQEEEVERKSLEVFGSSMMGRLRNKPISLEKRLAMLSWDHSNNNNLGGLFYNDDEVNSDCSSDLFEIESLTKQSNPLQSPTASCYAPSEASVEWSVVTASALDFDERRPSTTSPVRVVAPPRRVNVNKEVVVVQKRRSGSLLGCKSEKAVKIAEDSSIDRKINAKANSSSSSDRMEGRKLELSMPMPMPMPMPVKRFEDEAEARCLSFRSQAPPLLPLPHRALATRSLPRPYSPRLSNITFNIQGDHSIVQ